MANQTVTTAVNYDDASISGLLDGESITINGGSVTIDADVRWNQQAAVFGDITISSTLGGSLSIDGTKVWEIPFSASTGNVPTQQALGSNGVTGGTSGATGELTRVWAEGSLTPATAGGAMPSTGVIKLRSKTGTFQSGETVTLVNGATVTISSIGKRSWISVAGRANTGITSGGRLIVPRLGSFSVSGDWYELGTTNGADNQTFQFPIIDQCPAIWIETGLNSGIYEIWANAFDRWTGNSVSTSDKRGMFFGMDATTGIITIAARGTNVAGLKPPTGCRVRIPNVILSNGDAANYLNNINPTLNTASLYGFNSTTYGKIVLNNVICNWINNIIGMFSLSIVNSALAHPTNFSGCANSVLLENLAIAPISSISGTGTTINSFNGAQITDCRFIGRQNATAFSLTDSANITLNKVRCDVFGASGTNNPNGTAISATRTSNFTANDCFFIGGRILNASTASNITCNNAQYAVRTIGTCQTADITNPFSFASSSDLITINGFSNFDSIANVHNYAAIISVASNTSNLLITNIGTLSNPYDFGTSNPGRSVISGSNSRNITFRRVYTTNSRIALFELPNSIQNVHGYNAWGLGSQTQTITTSQSTLRGSKYLPSLSGQSGVFGTHWQDSFQNTTAGQIVISCNEPLQSTLDQCNATLDNVNGSGFTAIGDVSMKQLTDIVIWTCPYFVLGINGFQNTAPTITGTNISNHTFEFQYDIGNGYNGTWLPLTGTNLSAITVIPSVGIKLQVKATVNTANVGNLLTSISIASTTTATDQQTQYPLPASLLTVNGLIPQSRIKVLRVDTGALLVTQSVGAATSITFDISYSGAVYVEARNASSSTAYKPWVTQTTISSSSPTTVTALQEVD